MMNADAVLPNIDLTNIDDQHQYMHHYFNADQNHYMSPNQLGMPQLVDNTNQAVHYMPSKPGLINNNIIKPHVSSRNMNNMNQAYSHNMTSMAPMNSHNQILNSPPLSEQIGQNSSGNPYCKMPQSVPISNHYETPPMPRGYSQQNHHSPSAPSELNHYNQKYCNESNESVNISTTLTHISETDSSPHNINMISSSQTFSSMNPTNNWNTIPSNMNSHMKQCANTNSPNHSTFSNRNESLFNYLEPATDYHHSITSTPVSSQPQPDYAMRSTKNALNQNNFINKNNNNGESFSISKNDQTPKSKLATDCSHLLPNFVKKDIITAEKQTVIIFKVVEQIIDPLTKSVLKETIVKNEEVITSSGQVQFDLLSHNDTTTTCTSTNMTRSPVGSSGVLGDISGFSNSKSVNNLSTTNSIDLQANQTNSKNDCTFDSSVCKTENKCIDVSKDTAETVSADTQFIGSQSILDEESDEEERRQTASALLSLQSVSSTPAKKSKEEEQVNLKTPTTEVVQIPLPGTNISTALNANALGANVSFSKQRNETANVVERIKPGVKVMAKWIDKNFYPAEIAKQLEPHKWSVKFEDSANRKLFDTEMIRIEYLQPNQDVMLTISDDLCIRAVIKKVWMKNAKNIEVDLEYTEEEKSFTKRHKLRDIFLNTEQGSLILAKRSKPSANGAVFADVDLDNIVVGKRSRKQGNENGETTSKKKVADANSSSDNESTGSSNVNKKKRKHEKVDVKKSNASVRISIDCSSKKTDIYSIGHHHENSLSVSPRTSKSSMAMPPNELEKILGPMPRTSLKLFAQKSFMLTTGDRNRNLSEYESNAERSVPFDKTYLTKQIISGSGTVYDSFEEMKASGNNDCVLIADTYHRSIKYIQCLAAGIPIASHLWIIESCQANKLKDRDSYILPAGFSIITHSLSSDKSTLKKSSILFRGMKFYFGSTMATELENLWAPVLVAAQAIIVKQDPNMHNVITRKLVDIIIGDASCKPELSARAKQLKIAVVSSEYIVQCLINGRKLPFDSAKCFHPNASVTSI